ncbi:MAG: hypothetical protein DHS20C18_47560 [Saprospiraceae bacterium]|nr:MAG: hypothetical protein DHS20C18_47560 [Saprospiraceae bacterium]
MAANFEFRKLDKVLINEYLNQFCKKKTPSNPIHQAYTFKILIDEKYSSTFV